MSHQRLIDAIESTSDAFALFDNSGRLVLFNQRYQSNWEGTTGVRIQEGMTREEVREVIQQHARIETAISPDRKDKPELVCQLESGRWIRINERTTSDGGMVVLHTDITALKHMETVRREQELARQSRLLRRTVDNLSQGVALVNGEGNLEVWNSRFQELSGISTEVLSGQPDMESLLADNPIACLTPQTRDRFGRITTRLEQTLSDGRVIEIRTHPTHLRGYVNTYSDITELHQYAETLRKSEQWIRLIADNIPALVAYVGKDLRFQFTNKVYNEWYGIKQDAVYGKSISDVHGEEQFSKLKPYVDRALSGESVTFEVDDNRSGSSTHYMLRSYVPNISEKGETIGLFVLSQDVTERRETARALQQAYDNMEQRVRERTQELTTLNQQLRQEIIERKTIESHLLEAKKEAERANLSKTKFLAAASHDLLQPLNAARLFNGALLEKQLSQDDAHMASSVGRSLEDVESLLETLVDISKLDAGAVVADVTSFCVKELLDGIANEYQQIAKSSGLVFRYIPSSVIVESDSQLLARVLRNFLSNAIRYTANGRIVFGCRRKRTSLVIEVWDTGQGIPEDQLIDIFLEFKRLQSNSRTGRDKGLGLGLAIVDKISSVLGHQVSVASVENRGSVFSVEVPYGNPELPVNNPNSPELAITDKLQTAMIWVVDNDPMICNGMQKLLGAWGCDVVCALSQSDLLEKVDIDEASPDILIADYHLDDGINGIDMVGELEQKLKKLPQVLMITANYTPVLSSRVKDLGYFLQNKPVRPMKLKTTLNHLLELPERSRSSPRFSLGKIG